MCCRICKRGGCTESFHSFEEQTAFDEREDRKVMREEIDPELRDDEPMDLEDRLEAALAADGDGSADG